MFRAALQILASAIALVLFTAAASVEIKDLNGDWWRGQKPLAKATYVAGFFDGIASFDSLLDQELSRVQMVNLRAKINGLLDRQTTSAMVAQIDKFYADRRDRVIPARMAFWVVAMDLSGMPKAQVDLMKTHLREELAK